MLGKDIPLYVPQPDVCICGVEEQLWIVGIFGGAIQVFQNSTYKQLLGSGGAGEFANGFIDLREKAIAQFAQVFGTGLSYFSFCQGVVVLPASSNDPGEQSQQQ